VDTSLKSRALDYLQRHNVLTLATSGATGVWAAAVFYVNDGFTFYFLSSPTSRHSRNIAAQAMVAGTIQEDYRDWPEIKGVQLEGIAVQLAGAARLEAMRRYAAKFPLVGNLDKAPAAVIAALNKVVWYRLTPSRLYFIDNSRGFGHRDEITL